MKLASGKGADGVTNPPRGEDVVRHVRERIVTGQVRAGTFLRLDRLAEEAGVSVTPVREAMMQLRSQGFVEWQPRRGFVVLQLTGDDIRDIYQVQAFVAAELVRRAVRRLSQVDVDNLEGLQDRLEDAHAQGQADDVEQLNHEFHRELNTAALSPRLAHLLRTFTQYAPRLFFAEIEGWSEASASDHRAIIATIRRGDAGAAADAMAEHISRAGALLADHIDRQ
jgi:DNA-binding GntR family transcriptional regulator